MAVWNQSWLGLNSQRAYPLFETATKVDLSGSFAIPDDFLIEIYLPIPVGLVAQPENFFVLGVASYATGYSVTIGYDDGSASPPAVATAVVARATHTEYKSYALAGSGDFDDVVGRVTIGILDSIDAQPAGSYLFSRAATQLDPDCARLQIRGVSSIEVVNGTERSGRLYGDFAFLAGNNMQLSVVAIGQLNEIRFDAIDGAGLTENCACEEPTGPPIRTINGVAPDAAGNFTLTPNNCIDIVASGNGLLLTDKCSQPCCGCPELEAITAQLDHFGNEAATLQNFVARLRNQVDTLGSNVLGSRINSTGCSSC